MSKSTIFQRYWRFIPPSILGFVIGWNIDMVTTVEGASMVPTLYPKDYIIFAPYSLLHPLSKCFPSAFPSPLGIKEGDVVVVKISDTLSVCKRVKKIFPSWETLQNHESKTFATFDEHFAYLTALENHALTETNPTTSPQPPLEPIKPVRTFAWEEARLRVAQPQGWLWLEGDNAPESMDSRHCGAVPVDCLRGRVLASPFPRPRLIY